MIDQLPKQRIFPVKIPYTRGPEDKGMTPCPHGGALSSGLGVFKKGTLWSGAMVGSRACDGCFFNRETTWEYVKCSRKESNP